MSFLEDNPKSYTGQGQVINCSAGDPMKVQLGFFFEYAHCGEVPLTNRPPSPPTTSPSSITLWYLKPTISQPTQADASSCRDIL